MYYHDHTTTSQAELSQDGRRWCARIPLFSFTQQGIGKSKPLKKWQAYEGRSNLESSSSSLLPSLDNTQTSIPSRPYGFAESFTSADGR
ncbi:hypothetical protein F3Y22_tig00112281pilonHSYRG00232 [Hibiscus syriacus]|uniref:Uncharacterized protein n=1 Tax=Hibiscus syriacus TaxID=106335 RepID=A0A6A2XPW2_HIBSY|nr:hypothetical protein F3Y22_tig00112281pilonHSYRG00232 [Hibiscus syriacus]